VGGTVVGGTVVGSTAAGSTAAGRALQAREWWLSALHVRQTWRSTQGSGVTVAVLGTGVDAQHRDLAGAVITGPDYSRSGRTAGGPFWGINGTEVAGVIAGHGHGTGRADGIVGVAPMAKILSVRVGLEYNDPLTSDRAIARKLPGAIAKGIIYAVNHGARIIDLPLDPGTAGLTGQGSPAAAGGSAAERAAVAYALRKNVVLIAPAGDDAEGPALMDYPAAYRGVIAVGAVARDGRVAPFSCRRSYVALTAPGVGLTAAVPSDGYAPVSSTSASSGIVAGVAALVMSRFPHLTAAQVGQVLTGGTTPARTAAPGAGRGITDAARTVGLAKSLTAASEPSRPAAAPAGSHKPERLSTTAARGTGAGELAGSLVRYIVAGLGALIALLVLLLLLMRRRRDKSRAAGSAARTRGQHEQRRPGPVATPELDGAGRFHPGPPAAPAHPGPPAQSARPGPASPGRTDWAGGGWQGGSLGEMQPSQPAPFRPAMAPAPKPARTAAKTTASPAGPPWAPAPEPERTFGPLPTVGNSSLPPDPGPGIRVPGDMADLPAVPPDAMLPAPFDPNASPDPDFPPRPAANGNYGPDRAGPPELPTRQSLGFAAAPVPVDYAPPQAPDFTVPSRAAGLVLSGESRPTASSGPPAPSGPADAPPPGAGDPSYIWDLAATDVFPAAADPRPEAPGPVPEDGEPGASGR
jgi:Subtilase family